MFNQAVFEFFFFFPKMKPVSCHFFPKDQDHFYLSNPIFFFSLFFDHFWLISTTEEKMIAFQRYLLHWTPTQLVTFISCCISSGPFGNEMHCHAAIALQLSLCRQQRRICLLHEVALHAAVRAANNTCKTPASMIQYAARACLVLNINNFIAVRISEVSGTC